MEENVLKFHNTANITKQMPSQSLPTHAWNQDKKYWLANPWCRLQKNCIIAVSQMIKPPN